MNRYLGFYSRRARIRVAMAFTAIALSCTALVSIAFSATRLISQEELYRVGLTRAWFGQAQLDRSRNHLDRAVLKADRLTVLTSAGVVQDFNALTGAIFWTAPIGREDFPSLGPTCSDKFVALVNGSTLYVLDRADGRPVDIRRVGGAPGAAPALSKKYVFVPLVNGRIEGYSLAKDKNDKKLTPWYYQSMGRTMVAPLATPESIIWTTEMGNLYVGDSEDPKMRYRLETGSEILAPPAYRKPFVLVAAASGEVFAMQEMTGEREWKYGTGFPVTRTPAPVGDHVYVTSEEPALHCIDAKTGSMVWKAPHVLQFAAESKNRVYGVDDLGGLVVLDAAKGSVVGRIATDHPIQSLVNEQTDRVYLISDDGVIQCLREIDAKEPLYHSPKEPEMKKPEAGAQQQAEQPQPRPAEKSAPAKKESGQPAGEKPEKPAGPFGVPDSENPFGN